jgi:hypothetical protein
LAFVVAGLRFISEPSSWREITEISSTAI